MLTQISPSEMLHWNETGKQPTSNGCRWVWFGFGSLSRKSAVILNAINDEGNAIPLLASYFEALVPAFETGADEIRIEPAESGLRLNFQGKSLSVQLPDSPRNYATVVFPRILILAGMSIALEGAEQTGTFRARYNQQVIQIHVTSYRDDSKWYLIFRPGTAPQPTPAAH